MVASTQGGSNMVGSAISLAGRNLLRPAILGLDCYSHSLPEVLEGMKMHEIHDKNQEIHEKIVNFTHFFPKRDKFHEKLWKMHRIFRFEIH